MLHSASIIFALILAVYGTSNDYPIGVTVEQLLNMMTTKQVTIIDVREPWELKVEGKIAGSINIPGWRLKEELMLPPEEFQMNYGIPLPDKGDCDIIFHCKSGGRSLKAVTLARQMGWYCSRHLLGGFNAWQQHFQ